MARRIVVNTYQVQNKNLIMGFYMNGYSIIVDPRRNPALPPLAEQSWKGGRIKPINLISGGANNAARNLSVKTLGRPEDGIIHTRTQALSYGRRSSVAGKPPVQCKSWTDAEHNRLAALVCSGNLKQLLAYLASNGMPSHATCQRVATALNRSVGSVTGKLAALRKKALVSRRRSLRASRKGSSPVLRRGPRPSRVSRTRI